MTRPVGLAITALALGSLTLGGCAGPRPPAPPAGLTGTFADDYGSRHVVTARAWTQDGRYRYHVAAWRLDGPALVARNDAANPSGGGRWSRIDLVRLGPALAPYTWAFCLAAYDAPTRAAAEAAPPAARGTPRTGCNGYPFTRLRPVPAAAPADTAGAYR